LPFAGIEGTRRELGLSLSFAISKERKAQIMGRRPRRPTADGGRGYQMRAQHQPLALTEQASAAPANTLC
jgi:hypothetical protein